ncbi:thioredoxin family protein [Streptomyces sp. RY43-2]|uniref:Thioredoxin family protein n=1 Tax=Streptomyces macrolidinus TaxID=2952607 RepID=A0ABT0ZIK8_9ACTN|nr:thioredoxin family protein [Streptomyces macrolidinus]MCN9243375.1 thioredoxin family protein [Streptomyces macrolidinus]
MLLPGVVVAELGSSAVLLDTSSPTAAYLSPTALGWLQGRPPVAEHRDQHAHCFTQWRSAGLVAPDDTPDSPSDHDDLEVRAAECATLVRHPVLVVAMSDACGFCTQLTADLAANSPCLTGLDASVLLVDADGTRRLGRPLAEPTHQSLTRLGREAAPRGTPTAVLLTPDRPAAILTGFAEVSHALITLSGADPRATTVEAPTSCSVKIAAQPVDALVTTRVSGTHDNRDTHDNRGTHGTRLGIAVRGQEARRIVEDVTGGVREDGYTPVTLTVERPDTFYLLFRGGELLTRARTAADLCQALDAVLAGYAHYGSVEPGEIPLLCGAAVRDDEHAVLFPRTWVSDLVKRSRQLERAGWRLRPEPYTVLRPASDTPTLHLPDPDHSGQPGLAVTAVLTQTPESGGAPTRPRLLASLVNWIARPAATDAVHTLAASLHHLPVHTGTWEEALAHLTRATDANGATAGK